MAVEVRRHQPEHLRAIVDMGSNGIRFSISSLQPPTQRIMPTLYQHRVAISLYDAQYSASGERVPIDALTISAVISSFRQFSNTCKDFQVPEKHVTILATEATRTALNSEDFRKQIKEQVGWDVLMLAKEEEGRVGAMGVASSLPEVSGLVMDLGGGSTQLSWLVKTNGGDEIQMPPSGAESMPYGAAAMSRRLAEAERNGTTTALRDEVMAAVKQAYATLKVPEELKAHAADRGGFTLYLSGGGFRGWGYVLMSRHSVSPYPIPVINGFKVGRQDFLGVDLVKAAAAAALDENEEGDIFRVSDRRASQVPAVAFLISVLAEALPQIKQVRFCQGGVREGYLFSTLSPRIKSQHPLVVATQPFDMSDSSGLQANLLQNALPERTSPGLQDEPGNVFDRNILDAFANLMYYHASYSKDLQSTSALRSTSSGILAGVHGVLHESRALLALLLCARWGGDVPPSDEAFKLSLEKLVDSEWTLWWINYLGAVAALLGTIYPNGVVGNESRLELRSSWKDNDKPEKRLLDLQADILRPVDDGAIRVQASDIEKVGKRKRWIGGREGVGHKVAVTVRINGRPL